MKTIEQIKRIKGLRIRPEEKFLIDIFSKVEIKICDNSSKLEIYKVGNKILFEQCDDGWFSVDYYNVWSILSVDYGLNYIEISNLIRNIAWLYLKKKVGTPKANYNHN